MEYQEELAVVPLVPVDATPSTDTMLRMVLNHEALLVHHVLNDSLSGRPGQLAPRAFPVTLLCFQLRVLEQQ